jgi:hypothetical protein
MDPLSKVVVDVERRPMLRFVKEQLRSVLLGELLAGLGRRVVADLLQGDLLSRVATRATVDAGDIHAEGNGSTGLDHMPDRSTVVV